MPGPDRAVDTRGATPGRFRAGALRRGAGSPRSSPSRALRGGWARCCGADGRGTSGGNQRLRRAATQTAARQGFDAGKLTASLGGAVWLCGVACGGLLWGACPGYGANVNGGLGKGGESRSRNPERTDRAPPIPPARDLTIQPAERSDRTQRNEGVCDPSVQKPRVAHPRARAHHMHAPCSPSPKSAVEVRPYPGQTPTGEPTTQPARNSG